MKTLRLIYWDKSVSIGKTTLSIDLSQRKLIFLPEIEDNKEIFGWYAKYNEGVFYIFTDDRNNLYIGFDKNHINVSFVSSIQWHSNIKNRKFQAYSEGRDIILEFKYKTLINSLKKPWSILEDIFIPDDDWGLVSDLPSFIHSSFRQGRLYDDFNRLRHK